MQHFPFSKHNASHLNQNVLFWSHPSTKHFSNSLLACPHDLQQTANSRSIFFFSLQPCYAHPLSPQHSFFLSSFFRGNLTHQTLQKCLAPCQIYLIPRTCQYSSQGGRGTISIYILKTLKIPTKSTVHATVLKLSPNCSPNTAETLVHLNSLQIMKSSTQCLSKLVKLIKPISSHNFCSTVTKLARVHLQTFLHNTCFSDF